MTVPAAALMAAALAATGYYHWRVTGSALRHPYQVNRQTYGWPQTLPWQDAVPPGTYGHQTLYRYYLWERELHDRGRTWRGFALATVGKLKAFWPFFLGPALTPALLFLPRAVRDRRIRFLAIVCAVMALSMSGYGFFFPHYAAPVLTAIVAVLVQCLRHLRAWCWRGLPSGRAAVRWTGAIVAAMLLIAAAASPIVPADTPRLGWRPPSWYSMSAGSPRERLREALLARPGRHLMVVRYPPWHDVRREWVYNEADIDGGRIAWAHDLGEERNRDLLRYFGDWYAWRLVWEGDRPSIRPYAEPPR